LHGKVKQLNDFWWILGAYLMGILTAVFIAAMIWAGRK